MTNVALASSNQVISRYSGFRRLESNVVTHRPESSRTLKSRSPLEINCARIVNVEIPNKKRIECSLTYIYGIGFSTAKKILQDTGIENKRTYELEESELDRLREEVEKYTVEGELRKKVRGDIQRLIDIGCYRGRRHAMGLPVRGQRTKNNARTRKGKRAPAGFN
eukprot:g4042.t1